MRTDVKLLTIEDLCRELGVVYRDAGRRHDAIRAEIKRRIEVRDIIIADFLESYTVDGLYEALGMTTNGCVMSARCGEDDSHPPTYYINGEQIL